MRVVVVPDPKAVSEAAANRIVALLKSKPDAVLGLATGGTPLGTYAALIRQFQAGQVGFAECTTFNLDEYVGIPREHDQSYYTFMHENLFTQADFSVERCHLPQAEGDDLAAACQDYETQIDESGGIDLQILGIGSDGHIAFNEPGSSLASRTRVKALTEQTRQDNARFFASMDEVPRLAITMGIGTILEADSVLLLATGDHKADAIRATVEGPISAMVPASALQLHPQATILLDEAAASGLERLEYYKYVESLQQSLEAPCVSKTSS